jgi:hypothetical protein
MSKERTIKKEKEETNTDLWTEWNLLTEEKFLRRRAKET